MLVNKMARWADSNVRWLFVSTTISLTGAQFTALAFPWLALKISGDAGLLATVLVLINAPRIGLILVGGVAADLFPAKSLLIYTNCLNAVLLGVLGLCLSNGTLDKSSLLLISALLGVSSAFAIPAAASMLPRVVSREHLVKANSLFGALRQLVLMVGPLAAGALITLMPSSPSEALESDLQDRQGLTVAILIDAACFILANAFLSRIKVQPQHLSISSQELRMAAFAIGTGFQFLWKDVALRILVIYYALMSLLVVGPMQVGIPVLADYQLKEGASGLGLLMSSVGLGTLLGMFLSGSGRVSRVSKFGSLGVMILTFDAVNGAVLIGLGFSRSTAIAAMLAFTMGVAGGYLQVSLITWVQARIPVELLGRMMSIVLFVSFGMGTLSSAFSGLILSWFSISQLFAWSGALILVISGLFASLSATIRAIDATPLPTVVVESA
jgi:Major Facilitator Superfamily